VTTKALLPELPLLKMQNLIATGELQYAPAGSAIEFPAPELTGD
jgi:hypothetical protein